MWGEARDPWCSTVLAVTGAVHQSCHGEATSGGGGVILTEHSCEAPQAPGSEEVALNRAVPSAPLGNVRTCVGDIFSFYSPVEGCLEIGTGR